MSRSRHCTAVAILLVAVACLCGAPQVARAESAPSATQTASGAEVTVSSGSTTSPGHNHGHSGGGRRPKTCREGATTVTHAGLTMLCPGKHAPGFNPGISVTPFGPIVGLADPAPAAPTGAEVAQFAEGELVVPALEVATAPPRGGVQLVGVDVWFWAREASPVSATASVPGLSATVTARPVRLSIRVGGSRVATCGGGGVAYRARVGAGRDGVCRHVFQTAGPKRVVATLVWSLTWTASDGSNGRLPDARRSATFDLDIHDAYAITD